MNPYLRLIGLGTLMSWLAQGAVINDGTATNGLARFAGDDPSAVTWLVGAGDALAAEQYDLAFPVMNTAWYAETVTATSGVYSVMADFKPDKATPECRGGVVGWLNLASSNAIALYVVPPGSTESSFRLACIDFLQGDASQQLHLFELTGLPATDASSTGWKSDLAGYVATNPATFELAFTSPTPADLAALTNTTAHIIARVWQGDPTNRVQVGRTLELLTDLPLPGAGDHRFGYFAAWGLIFGPPFAVSRIGLLDTLTAEGGIGTATPPTPATLSIRLVNDQVVISWPAEAAGATLQATSDIGQPGWTNLVTSGTSHTETLAAGPRFFRLKQ